AQGGHPGTAAVRRAEAPARPRARRGRPPRRALPRRAHHRHGPGGAPRHLGGDRPAARRGHHRAAHHPLPGGGRAPRRPPGDHARGPHPRARHGRRGRGRGRRPHHLPAARRRAGRPAGPRGRPAHGHPGRRPARGELHPHRRARRRAGARRPAPAARLGRRARARPGVPRGAPGPPGVRVLRRRRRGTARGDRAAPGGGGAMRADVRHAVRLARLDLKLLGRNQTALVNVVLLPLLMAWMFSRIMPEGATTAGVPAELFVLTGVPGLMLCFAVFVNLVNNFTARREELVLKRLYGGLTSPAAVFGGAALSALLVYLGQVALLAIWIVRVEGGSAPANIPLLLLASVLGAAVI